LHIKEYNRENSVRYAQRWAFERNPLFYSFENEGGDCTNFVSQCVFAGSCTMNYTKTFGWYYNSVYDRAPAWTGVAFFYNFITSNKSVGPFGKEVQVQEVELGDVIQLYNERQGYYHTLIVTGFRENDFLVSANSYDAYNRALNTYFYDKARYIHIEGIRAQKEKNESCFTNLINGKSLY